MQMVAKIQENMSNKRILAQVHHPNQDNQITEQDKWLLVEEQKSNRLMTWISSGWLIFTAFSTEQIDEFGIFAKQHV
jgi:hypothetical protein